MLPFSSTFSRSSFCTVLLACIALCSIPGAVSFAAETPAAGHAEISAASHDAAPAAHEAHEEHHGLPSAAPVLRHVGPFPINSSMVLMWVVAGIIIGFAQYATRNLKQVPDGAQNFWEWLVESLRNFLETIIGRDLTKTTFWFFASVFIFILASNWIGLLPGVGTIGWGHTDDLGVFHITQPLLRGVNADLNLTFAMACVFFLCWMVWAVKANGFGGVIMHIFGTKGETSGIMKYALIVIFFLVGLLEVVSIAFRPISLSLRLYGNIFAGENMLEAMAHLVPWLAPIIPIPFYFLELLVGLVQALVFMLLTAVFTLLICSHADGDHEHKDAHH